ncbi:MAG: restriction endonuclease subunit S [Planctomycetaceae bacterium]
MTIEHWQKLRLSEAATKVGSGATPTGGKEAYHTSGIPLIRSQNVRFEGFTEDGLVFLDASQAASLDNAVVCKNDVLLNITGASIGRVTLAPPHMDGARVNQHVTIIRLKDEIDPSFVRWFIASPSQQRQINSIQVGVTRQALTKDMVLRFELPLPPFGEQKRIVAKIEELFSDLDAGEAALKRAKANLKRYRAAVLKAAVEGKLTEEWRAKHPAKEPASSLLARILKERRQKWEADQLAKFAAAEKEPPKNWREKYVEPTPPVTTGLPELPDSWCWVTLGQLLHQIEGGKSFECLTRPAGPNEWGVVKVSAMTWGTFLEDEQKAIPPAAEFDPSDEIRPNDLLLSRSNTTQLVGATVLVGNCRPRLLLSDKSLRLRAIEFVNLHWLHTALSSSVARSQLSAMATGTSDSMRNVSQDKIKSVVLPLPPLAEQQWIVEGASERLSQIDAAETQIEHGLLRASRLRQSILKQAFEGKLVPQDPNDESASTLLARLVESRTQVGQSTTKPKTVRRKAKT